VVFALVEFGDFEGDDLVLGLFEFGELGLEVVGSRVVVLTDGGVGAAQAAHVFERAVKAARLVEGALGLFLLHFH
jgi:hypothetical protein